jgi:hypothetical protein
MWLTRLNKRIAADAGVSLADQFIAVAPASKAEGRQTQSLDRERGKALHVLLTGVDRDARPLQLGFFRRAKLGNAFKWRLLEHGVDPALADELTRLVLRRRSSVKPGVGWRLDPRSVPRGSPGVGLCQGATGPGG